MRRKHLLMNDCDHNHNDPKDNNITTLTHTYQVKLHDAIDATGNLASMTTNGGNSSNVANTCTINTYISKS